MRWPLLLLPLFFANPVWGSHQWGGIDLCEVKKDVMPPGFPPEKLPAPEGEGAQLLQHYCEQCHNLPGPGRHTATEWQEVADRMFLLMDVSHRFGGLLGEINTPDEAQRVTLSNYLQHYALKPWNGLLPPPEFYQSACSGCHTLPDPTAYSSTEWPEILQRMVRNASVMEKGTLSASSLGRVERFLGIPGAVRDSAYKQQPDHPLEQPSSSSSIEGWLAISPLLILVPLGFWRWWRIKS